MKKKKVLILCLTLLVCLSVGLLTSCKKDEPDPDISFNINDYTDSLMDVETYNPMTVSIKESKLSDYMTSDYTVTSVYSDMYRVTEQATGNKGMFSIKKDDFIIPISDISFNSPTTATRSTSSGYGSTLLRVYSYNRVDGEDTTTVWFDSLGNELYSMIGGATMTIEAEDSEYVYEKRRSEYSAVLAFEDAAENVSYVTIKFNGYGRFVKTNDVYSPDEYVPVAVGGSFATEYSSAALFGDKFKDYTYRSMNLYVGSYVELMNKDGQVVSSFTIPSNASVMGFVDGCIMYSIEKEVESMSTNYDIYDADSNSKIVVDYYSIDILSGTIVKCDTDFYIASVENLLIKNNSVSSNPLVANNDYMLASVINMADKTTDNAAERLVVLNKDFVIVKDLSDSIFGGSASKLSDNRYLIGGTFDARIVNEKFEVVYMFGSEVGVVNVNASYGLIFARIDNGGVDYYGALDFDGKIVIPFCYDSSLPSARFIEGRARAYNVLTDEYELVGKNYTLSLANVEDDNEVIMTSYEVLNTYGYYVRYDAKYASAGVDASKYYEANVYTYGGTLAFTYNVLYAPTYLSSNGNIYSYDLETVDLFEVQTYTNIAYDSGLSYDTEVLYFTVTLTAANYNYSLT